MVKWSEVSHSVMSDSLRPHWLFSPWNSPGQNTGAGSLSLLQEIFSTQASNPGVLHCRQILYQLNHKGSPRVLEWVANGHIIKTELIRKQTLNETSDQMDLIDIFSTFISSGEEYTFFSSAHGTFSRIDHNLGHKISLSKVKKIEIVSSIFSNHNSMRLDISYKKKKCKKYNHIEIKQYISK